MLEWISTNLTNIANSLVILIVGVVGGLGINKGRKVASTEPAPAPFKMEGAAIVSSESVMALARAVEAHNGMVSIENRRSTGELKEAIEDLGREVHELRHELAIRRRTS